MIYYTEKVLIKDKCRALNDNFIKINKMKYCLVNYLKSIINCVI